MENEWDLNKIFHEYTHRSTQMNKVDRNTTTSNSDVAAANQVLSDIEETIARTKRRYSAFNEELANEQCDLLHPAERLATETYVGFELKSSEIE